MFVEGAPKNDAGFLQRDSVKLQYENILGIAVLLLKSYMYELIVTSHKQ